MGMNRVFDVVRLNGASDHQPRTTTLSDVRASFSNRTITFLKTPLGIAVVGDLDCGDISQRNFRVIGGRNPYRLDSDNDGIACEQN
jgi:Excalibur calcium-binding domain